MSTAYVSMTAPQDDRESTVQQLRNWWYRLPGAVRARSWPAALAALTIVFQLLAFHQIVTQAVRKGEALRAAYPVAVAPVETTDYAPVNTALARLRTDESMFVR